MPVSQVSQADLPSSSDQAQPENSAVGTLDRDLSLGQRPEPLQPQELSIIS